MAPTVGGRWLELTKSVLGRLVEMSAIILVISMASFSLLGLTKGDVATAAVQAKGIAVTPERVAAERHRLGLDLPPAQRYVNTLGRALHGDFGVSVRTGREVTGEVVERLVPTITLAAAGGLVTVLVGLMFGLVETIVQGRVVPALLRGASLVFVSLPGFALAFLLVALFSVQLGWFPTQGMGGGLGALVLPALVLGLPAGAALGRVLSTRLQELLSEQYMVTARAQGYPRAECILRWALPNAAVTSLVVGGNLLALLVTSTVVVEQVFGWPGIGSYLIDSLRFRDWYPLQASVLLLSAMAVFVRGLSLALAAAVDPRARVAR
jgi:ABC-type dipeptide/oligopeptide/nickel transport system permease component